MLTTLVATLILAQAPCSVTADRLPFDPAKLGELVKVEIKLNEDGQVVTYSGVPLATLLETQAKNVGSMAGLRALSDSVLLVRGTDGYQAAVSAAAVAMDAKGERFLLAMTRNGKPLETGQGPVRLIVPNDPKHVRWVKDVATIRIIRLDKLANP
jgi:Oxidoreductase molybdopterin binding domain